jgi:hypothetical protein
MSPKQLGKLWTVIGAILLYYALNAWIVTQGGHEIFGMRLVAANRVPAAMVAIPICALLLIATSAIGILYALRTEPRWPDRIPVVGFETLNTKAPESKVYQGAMLFLLSILPALSLIHFWRMFTQAKLVTTSRPPALIASVWDWSKLTSWDDPARICTTVRETAPAPPSTAPGISCEGGATVLPGIEPTLLAVLTGLAAAAMILHGVALFRRPPAPILD